TWGFCHGGEGGIACPLSYRKSMTNDFFPKDMRVGKSPEAVECQLFDRQGFSARCQPFDRQAFTARDSV
ncbi:MAG: hypothetical protein II130_07225, partial [Bacteroidales bacterium]|nr:hypothetical protein [Bacteroidales bacterium]